MPEERFNSVHFYTGFNEEWKVMEKRDRTKEYALRAIN